MTINLSPQKNDTVLIVVKAGDALTINKEVFDFTQIPNGGLLPKDAITCEWIISDVKRVNGELELTLLLPIRSEASEAARFPQPIINPPNGTIKLPI
jgi:hypothetical protein